jgi:hypothetical protein
MLCCMFSNCGKEHWSYQAEATQKKQSRVVVNDDDNEKPNEKLLLNFVFFKIGRDMIVNVATYHFQSLNVGIVKFK